MISDSASLTFADHVRARAHDDKLALLFGEERWTYREWCVEVAARASWWRTISANLPLGSAPHIGILLENTPEFSMWLGAAAVCGSTVVGINPTRRGAELERDITYTECQIVVTDSSQVALLEDLDLGPATEHVYVAQSSLYQNLLAGHIGAELPNADEIPVAPSDQFLLLFTSGTSGAPKAVITSHQRLNSVATSMRSLVQLEVEDVTYIAMPLFHSNALFAAWAPSVLVGCAIALRPKFSGSEFLADVRKFGATFFNYVGKPLAYILATPEKSDDAENPLRRGFGNEGSEGDIARFAQRFNCPLQDGYGQTETGASVVRVAGMPGGSLGMPAQATIVVLDPHTGQECPSAEFDEGGRLLNAEQAIGEIVNKGGGTFEGYWKNDEANRQRIRHGAYWTGDLAYRDAQGFFFFAGRSADWLRVDGENFAGAPIERILLRYPNVILSAVYGVPDPEIGDRVMAALLLQPDTIFNIEAFTEFLQEQNDLGPKWIPSFIQVLDEFPMTQTNKILKRDLVRRGWQDVENDTAVKIWWREGKEIVFRPFGSGDAKSMRSRFEASGRANLLL